MSARKLFDQVLSHLAAKVGIACSGHFNEIPNQINQIEIHFVRHICFLRGETSPSLNSVSASAACTSGRCVCGSVTTEDDLPWPKSDKDNQQLNPIHEKLLCEYMCLNLKFLNLLHF